MKNENLQWHKVRRGEVYLCDFGESFGIEQGGLRPAIIVQNNVGNNHSNSTIVIPCTSKRKNELPTHYTIDTYFLKSTSIAMAEQVRTIDKKRLINYLGILSPDIMKKIDEILCISLGL